jgi:hypothetical protein
MFASLAIASLVFAAAGLAGGLYLACRYEWPRRLYARLFGARM